MKNDNSMVQYKYETDRGMVELNADTVRKYLVPDDSNVTDQEVVMFLELCKYQKLNPFLREAYLVKYGNSPASIVTGKEVFTQRAQADPKFAGFEAGITLIGRDGNIKRRDGSLALSSERIIGGWAKVYIKGYTVPLFDEVSFAEYAGRKKDGTLTKMWKEKPATMIRKVALVHALREAFPDRFKGLYSQEEINSIDQSTLPQNEIREEDMKEAQVEDDNVVAGDEQAEDEVSDDPFEATSDYYNEDEEETKDIDAPPEPEHYEQQTAPPVGDRVIGFGKHSGKTIAQIEKSDRGYVEWLARAARDMDVRADCEEYLSSVRPTKKKEEEQEDPDWMDDSALPFDL